MGSALDAETFRRSMSLYAEALRRHRDEINSLNVFPVPDGDTGTNMLLTQEAVVSALGQMDGAAGDLSALAGTVARASLMGARGNSGVILSQVLRGLAERLAASPRVEPGTLAGALRHASEEADRAVARPVDGTVLSVLRDAAAAASRAVEAGADVPGVVDAALEGARRSLARTTNLLPELREAGVVDAGASGLVLLFDALRAALRGEPLSVAVGALGPVGRGAPGRLPPARPLEQEFEVQYLIEADEEGVVGLRRALGEIGDSVAVVGGGGLYNVHVHTNDAAGALEMGRLAGEPAMVSTTSLRDAVAGCIGGQARAVQVAGQLCGLVAVADGDGLQATFRSLGAVVVAGGPGADPSVGDLLAAIEWAPAEEVLVLPNHPNFVPSSMAAAEVSRKTVRVVPTNSIPAGISAATAFNPMSPLATNESAASDAARSVRAGAVVRAERPATLPGGGLVRPGDWVGMSDGVIVAVGPTPAAAAVRLVEILAARGPEIVTVAAGSDAGQAEADEVSDAVAEALPGAEVQVLDGGQALYRYLIGVE